MKIAGMTIGHTHLYAALARGLVVDLQQPRCLRDILERLWWRLDRALDERSLRCSAEVALLDAVACGATTVVDHHESPALIDGSLDILAEAAQRIGVRLVACYGSSDRNGQREGMQGLRENERFLQRVSSGALGPNVAAMVGLHAAFTVGAETLAAHSELARQFGVGIHVHCAEDSVDAGALERLAVDARTLLAHCVHLDARARATVRAAESWVAHNPRSNQQNAVGYAPVDDLGGRVLLGTDGMDGDLLAELRAAHLCGRQCYGPTGGVDAVAMLHNGNAFATSLGFDVSDDAVTLRYDPPTPTDHWDGHLLFGVSSRHIESVVVAGRPVYQQGEFLHVDAARMRADARAAAAAMWKRL
jgi:cytosine/adenosine deaminase-related metal-dependent hydrolase